MLKFNEELHLYTLNDVALRSVTQVVESQFKPFNAKVMSTILSNTKANDPTSQYFGMDAPEIRSKWAIASKDSREKGTALHNQIDCFFKHGHTPQEQTLEWQQFMHFMADHPQWSLLGAEVRVNNDTVAGTIDAVFETPEGIVLVDWKRARAIDYSGHGMGRDYMRFSPDCNYSKYSLQLSLYRELFPGEVVGCYIVQMHPDIEDYRKMVAQDYSQEARLLLQ